MKKRTVAGKTIHKPSCKWTPKSGPLNIDSPEFIKIKEVMDITKLGKTQIYDLIRSGKFPAQIRLSKRSSAWIKQEISAWGRDCVADRDAELIA